MEIAKTTSLDELFKNPPELIFDWLENVWSGAASAPENFNWLGLAEGAALRVHAPSEVRDRNFRLAWAKIAVGVYDYIAASSPPDLRELAEYLGMTLRAV